MIRRLFSRFADLRREQSGVAVVMVALLMSVLLGMAAFAVDFGWIYWNVIKIQHGADAAALSGVIYEPGNQTHAYQHALEAASENGYVRRQPRYHRRARRLRGGLDGCGEREPAARHRHRHRSYVLHGHIRLRLDHDHQIRNRRVCASARHGQRPSLLRHRPVESSPPTELLGEHPRVLHRTHDGRSVLVAVQSRWQYEHGAARIPMRAQRRRRAPPAGSTTTAVATSTASRLTRTSGISPSRSSTVRSTATATTASWSATTRKAAVSCETRARRRGSCSTRRTRHRSTLRTTRCCAA